MAESDREGERTVLASRPPGASLISLLFLLGLALAVALVFRFFLVTRPHLLSPSQGALFWIRIAVLAVVGVGGVFTGAAVVRIVLRWARRASVAVEGDELVFRVPAPRPWWRLLDGSLREVRIPRTEVRGVHMFPSAAIAVAIYAEHTTVAVPNGLFATGAHAIDGAIRRYAGAGEWPHPTAPVEVLARWDASWPVRLGILGAGIAMLGLDVVFTAMAGLSGAKLGFLPFVLGIGLLISLGYYRGSVILDRRGVFWERGGATSVVLWSQLDPHSPAFKSNLLGIWRELEIRAARTSTAGAGRFALNQILWLGFPLRRIEHRIREVRAAFR